ncbi:hypothetical protein LSAT2_015559 [Lamellibrachia satsuma]|nr:hypothetical protein LSAT2_015559 [Lamellibrachia satsuma]
MRDCLLFYKQPKEGLVVCDDCEQAESSFNQEFEHSVCPSRESGIFLVLTTLRTVVASSYEKGEACCEVVRLLVPENGCLCIFSRFSSPTPHSSSPAATAVSSAAAAAATAAIFYRCFRRRCRHRYHILPLLPPPLPLLDRIVTLNENSAWNPRFHVPFLHHEAPRLVDTNVSVHKHPRTTSPPCRSCSPHCLNSSGWTRDSLSASRVLLPIPPTAHGRLDPVTSGRCKCFAPSSPRERRGHGQTSEIQQRRA